MIKFHIETLEGESEWEIKPSGEGHALVILKSTSEYHRDPGQAWHGQIVDRAAIQAIEDLIEHCFLCPSDTKWITILDGIGVTVRYSSPSSGAIRFRIKDFEDDLPEVQLMRRIFGLARQVIDDPGLEAHIMELEGYFRDTGEQEA